MSIPEPAHTFVILAYNESKYLEECIKSVIYQSIPSQVIIATSTPNEFISALALKYKIKVQVNINTGTIGKDWNFGYRCAGTKYVTLAHQDDIYVPQFAEKSIAAAERNISSEPLIVFNKSIVYKGEKEVGVSYKNILRWLFIFPFHFKRCIDSKPLKKSILLFSNGISCPGVFYVKANLGNFKFDEKEKYILDWRAWYNMSREKGSFIYISDVLHIHREHEESATSSTEIETLQKEEFALLSQIWGNKLIAKVITGMLRIAK